jgi:outer membrane lipoprotein carrier protein
MSKLSIQGTGTGTGMGWRHFVWLLALVCNATALASIANDQAAERRVDETLGEIRSLRSRFEQTLSGAHGEVLEQAGGMMYLEKPNRFRWAYETGVRQLIVADGERIWLYDQELEQVTVRALGQSLAATPAMLLSGSGRASDSFRISDLGPYEGLAWIRLLPKTADTDFREIRLGFSGKELARMTLKDKLGQTTELKFLGLERNPALDRALFQFTPPPGVDVIGNPGP